MNDLYSNPEDKVVSILMMPNLGGRFQGISPNAFVYDALLGMDIREILKGARETALKQRGIIPYEAGEEGIISEDKAIDLYRNDVTHLLIGMPNDIIFERLSEALGQVGPESLGKGRRAGTPFGIQTVAYDAVNINKALRDIKLDGNKAYLVIDVEGEKPVELDKDIEKNNIIIRYKLKSLSERELGKLIQFVEDVTVNLGMYNTSKALLGAQNKDGSLKKVNIFDEDTVVRIIKGPKKSDKDYAVLKKLHDKYNDITPFGQPDVEFAKKLVKGGRGVQRFNEAGDIDADGLPVRKEEERRITFRRSNQVIAKGPVLDSSTLGLRDAYGNFVVGSDAEEILKGEAERVKYSARLSTIESRDEIVNLVGQLEDLQDIVSHSGVPLDSYQRMQELKSKRHELFGLIQKISSQTKLTPHEEETAVKLASLILKAHKKSKTLGFVLYEDRNELTEILKKFADFIGFDLFGFGPAEQHKYFQRASGGRDISLEVLIQSVKKLSKVRATQEKVIYDGCVPKYLHDLYGSEVADIYLRAYSDRFREDEVQTETAILMVEDATERENVANLMVLFARVAEICESNITKNNAKTQGWEAFDSGQGKNKTRLYDRNCLHCDPEASPLKKYPVFETEHFRVVHDAHPLKEGHVLIIPKEHYSCAGEFPEEVFKEFKDIYTVMSEFLRETYGQIAVFEHGAIEQTVRHAHVHFMPFANSVSEVIPERNALTPIDSIDKVKDIFVKEGKYLFIGIGDKMWTLDTRSITGTGLFRNRFARLLGVPDRADWKETEKDPVLMQGFDEEFTRFKEKWDRSRQAVTTNMRPTEVIVEAIGNFGVNRDLIVWRGQAESFEKKRTGGSPDFMVAVSDVIRPNDKVLEIAAGPFIFNAEKVVIANAGSVVVTDLVPWNVDRVNEKIVEKRLQNKASSQVLDMNESFAFPDASFDVVISDIGLLQNVDNEQTMHTLEEIRRVLRPGGRLVFRVKSTEDYRYGQGEEYVKEGQQIMPDVFVRFDRHVPEIADLPRLSHFWSKETLTKILTAAGFEIMNIDDTGKEVLYDDPEASSLVTVKARVPFKSFGPAQPGLADAKRIIGELAEGKISFDLKRKIENFKKEKPSPDVVSSDAAEYKPDLFTLEEAKKVSIVGQPDSTYFDYITNTTKRRIKEFVSLIEQKFNEGKLRISKEDFDYIIKNIEPAILNLFTSKELAGLTRYHYIQIAQAILRMIYPDLYEDIKDKDFNKVCARYPEIRDKVQGLKGSKGFDAALNTAIKYSAMVNILETAYFDEKSLSFDEEDIEARAIDIGDFFNNLSEKLKVHTSGKILYYVDNVGELPMDMLVVEFLLEKGYEVVLLAKDNSAKEDLTVRDVEKYLKDERFSWSEGYRSEDKLRIFSTDSAITGLNLVQLKPGHAQEYRDSIFSIYKGGGNLYGTYPPALTSDSFYIFTIKEPIQTGIVMANGVSKKALETKDLVFMFKSENSRGLDLDDIVKDGRYFASSEIEIDGHGIELAFNKAMEEGNYGGAFELVDNVLGLGSKDAQFVSEMSALRTEVMQKIVIISADALIDGNLPLIEKGQALVVIATEEEKYEQIKDTKEVNIKVGGEWVNKDKYRDVFEKNQILELTPDLVKYLAIQVDLYTNGTTLDMLDRYLNNKKIIRAVASGV